MIYSFSKGKRKTIAEGTITVPKKFYLGLGKTNICSLTYSTKVTYVLPTGKQLNGKLYQSTNNSGTYYQFYIIESRDRQYFKEEFANLNSLKFTYDLSRSQLNIFP